LLANFLFISKIGGLSVLITNPHDISQMVSQIAKFKFTVITGVNTLFNALVNHPEFSKLDFSTLKITLGGGMAVQRVVADKWQTVTGIPLLEAYGLTEASPAVTINPTTLKAYNGTIGLPLPSTDVAILDEEGHEVPLGQSGELGVKGPQVMRGYWQNPLETQKVFTKTGWLLTGDIASINPQGYVSILERKKDMILVSGFNVYPNDIEDVLMHIPGVLEAAVIGVPDEHTGQAVKAFIVRSEPNLTVDTVLRFCRENLTGYKMPKSIEFRDSLPKSNVGKILRRALR
jgi:long-chain acyl-CoA synthetase